MATRKMSAEEAAVRKALAAVQADTGLEQARQIIQTGVVPTATATTKPTYEESRSLVSQVSDPIMRAALEKAFAGGDASTERLKAQAEAIGYEFNPNTGVVQPRTETGNVVTGAATTTTPLSTTPLSTTPTVDTKKIDAIAAISALLSSYGLGDLSGAVTEAVQKGYTSDTIQLIMQDPNSKDPLAVAFQTRFSANKVRAAAGKAVLSPGEYLAAERSYTQVLQSYGVASMATKDKLSSFISNDISAAEVADRVGLAIDRVKNADPFVKAALAEYYPSLNQADIVSAVLDPVEGLPALKRKVQIAEIGGAAAIQGLKTGLGSMSGMAAGLENVTTGALGAEALASFGITQEEARKGYQTVAGIAPRAEFLSSISTGEDYTRLQAEQEAFLGLASAKRARESLTAQEEGRFKGQSGLTKTTLTQSGAGQY